MSDPRPPGPERRFRDYLRDGRFMLQRRRDTGECLFYPRAIAPGVGTVDFEWIEASGNGTVYATTTVRQRPEKGSDYNVALIDLAEGPRMMSRVVGIEPTEVAIGMAVTSRIDSQDGEPLIVFEPAQGTST